VNDRIDFIAYCIEEYKEHENLTGGERKTAVSMYGLTEKTALSWLPETWHLPGAAYRDSREYPRPSGPGNTGNPIGGDHSRGNGYDE
jgi:hypothetical protein